MKEAMKHDQGKLPLHLIDPLWLTTTARVLDFGQKKYAAWNWAQGTFAWSRLYSALQRHLNAWWGGEYLDPETGLPHLWHANCCLMFLTRYVEDGMGKDDRPKFPHVPIPETHPVQGTLTQADADMLDKELAKMGGIAAITNTPRPGETPEQTAARTAPRKLPTAVDLPQTIKDFIKKPGDKPAE